MTADSPPAMLARLVAVHVGLATIAIALGALISASVGVSLKLLMIASAAALAGATCFLLLASPRLYRTIRDIHGALVTDKRPPEMSQWIERTYSMPTTTQSWSVVVEAVVALCFLEFFGDDSFMERTSWLVAFLGARVGVSQLGVVAWRRHLWTGWLERLEPRCFAPLLERGGVNAPFGRRVLLRIGSTCIVVLSPALAYVLRGTSSPAEVFACIGLFLLVNALTFYAALRVARNLENDLRDVRRYVRSLHLNREQDVSLIDRGPAFRTTSGSRLASKVIDLVAAIEKNAQNELDERDRAFALARLRARFVAFMSHDLRLPLNAILGFSGLLKNETSGPLNHEQADSVEAIQEAGTALLELLSDIIDSARLQSGKLPLHVGRHSVRELVLEAVGRVQLAPETSSAQFEIRFPEEDTVAMVDREWTVRAMVNVLSHVALWLGDEREIPLWTLSESGAEVLRCGLVLTSGEDSQRMFAGPRDVRSRSGKRVGGLGLGLALARNTLLAQGGDLLYSSQGTDNQRGFTFRFPIAERE